MEALFVSIIRLEVKMEVLVNDTSSPWHDGNQVLCQVEDSVADVSFCPC